MSVKFTEWNIVNACSQSPQCFQFHSSKLQMLCSWGINLVKVLSKFTSIYCMWIETDGRLYTEPITHNKRYIIYWTLSVPFRCWCVFFFNFLSNVCSHFHWIYIYVRVLRLFFSSFSSNAFSIDVDLWTVESVCHSAMCVVGRKAIILTISLRNVNCTKFQIQYVMIHNNILTPSRMENHTWNSATYHLK